ncbi:MAG: DUF2283 domain-containing protein, partial [Nanoarchaeota archaeon]|nr:DUF2283 domain-containing protein [Nanoarchaeota archaeon]
MRSMQKFNFDYDSGNDDLFLYNPQSKSKASIEMGDFILDYNNRKELVGIEIVNYNMAKSIPFTASCGALRLCSYLPLDSASVHLAALQLHHLRRLAGLQ